MINSDMGAVATTNYGSTSNRTQETNTQGFCNCGGARVLGTLPPLLPQRDPTGEACNNRTRTVSSGSDSGSDNDEYCGQTFCDLLAWFCCLDCEDNFSPGSQAPMYCSTTLPYSGYGGARDVTSDQLPSYDSVVGTSQQPMHEDSEEQTAAMSNPSSPVPTDTTHNSSGA